MLLLPFVGRRRTGRAAHKVERAREACGTAATAHQYDILTSATMMPSGGATLRETAGMFFFEKKEPKNLYLFRIQDVATTTEMRKSFLLLFSKKKTFLRR